MHGRKGILATVATVSLMVVTLGTAQGKTPEPIRIGLLLALSGPAAPFGVPEQKGVEILAKKINSQGGINGHPIKLYSYDTKTNPTEAARGMRHLAQVKHVVAVIGATTGSGTLAAGPMAKRAKVPMLAPDATLAVTSKDNTFYPWVFRSLSSDKTNTALLIKHATAGGRDRVGIFYQQDAYGKDAYQYVEKLLGKHGGKVVVAASAPLNATDVTPQATKLRKAHPDVVLLLASAPDLGGAFGRAAKQVGLNAPIWADLGLGQHSFIKACGSACNGVHIDLLANWDDPTPGLRRLGKLLRSGGMDPKGFGPVISTNGLLAIVHAAKTVNGEITGPKLRDTLEHLCGFKTYSPGKGCFSKSNHNGWGSNFLTTAKIENGKFERVR